jgi:hypothetical protein
VTIDKSLDNNEYGHIIANGIDGIMHVLVICIKFKTQPHPSQPLDANYSNFNSKLNIYYPIAKSMHSYQ